MSHFFLPGSLHVSFSVPLSETNLVDISDHFLDGPLAVLPVEVGEHDHCGKK